MSKLYESIDKLKNFTALKEDVVVKELDPMVTHITLYYEPDLSKEIGLCRAIKGFNNFDNKGYLIADMEPFILDEEFPGFFTALNEVKVIIVHFSDGIKKEYGISWCSAFNKITDDMYIMLFETKNGEYYNEDSKL